MPKRIRVAPATVALLVSAALASLACGGGAKEAQDYIPDLSDMGLATLGQGPDPFAGPELDTWRAQYQSSDGRGALIIAYVEQSDTAAETRYATFAVALENPPPEFFGGSARQTETEALEFGDERRSFVTAEPDDAGNLVWTDIYRSGRAIAIIQLLIQEEEDAESGRRTIAEAVLD